MEILNLIKEPVFLVTSTGMSILISVAANLLTPKIYQLLSFFSSSLKTKQTEKKRAYVSKVILAASDENKVINIKLDVSYALLKSLVMIVFSLFLLSVSPYIYFAEYVAIFISLSLVTYALSLFNSAQVNYRIATLATLRAEKMASLRAELNAASRSEYEHYDNDYVDPQEEMYIEYLAEWDKKHL
ncbi:TPA: hypothetical protein NGT77_004586 [Vibrio parahaemolyticus]|uniref:DUF2721 domain-containing protein n=1 Tax=Vibrio japonicus TaxID=1824638 RepID=A0ABY5LJC2_9VIBR|nr:hypothetical protein [Vibrio japonicus]UUM32169.1 hypothetical protein NP165_17895 [Vibrio japonicus]HCE2343444.1 hypothetical protein [Vibrio parahaemolyticus]HCH1634726.1 hypothetical protein [Vibrio parahaemolyticus]